MKQLTNLRKVLKINSAQLGLAGWNFFVDLDKTDLIVTISESQVIRWIDELTGRENISDKITVVKKKISALTYQDRTKKTRQAMKVLQAELQDLAFVPEYISVIMDSVEDYHRANQGFTVNGKRFRRLLGTNGGIKKSTIVYIQEDLYPEIKKRIDNGRDLNKELVPAKLEAYQGLCCSSSTPLPRPRGLIVVDDCITHFKEDVIKIDDNPEKGGEPILTYVDDYEIEHNGSDGFGLMSPGYAKRVNWKFNHKRFPVPGMCTRWAWEKGMLCTFDFVHFAEVVAGSYFVRDAWGTIRDVRDADVILTTSMLKLWDSYDSMESYIANCEENHYQFAATKLCPDELENVRNLNYQFLQSYDLTDEEIVELCRPTVEEIHDVMGMDYRKSIVYAAGKYLNEKSVLNWEGSEEYPLALMMNPETINDDYIYSRLRRMIEKRIEDSKKGSIMANGNFAMIFGDPYALAQSMFGMEVTGLLNAGEIFHRYWLDRDVEKVVCFRAPMTNHNNLCVREICNRPPAKFWYQYIKTGIILNDWDTTCDALNGADFDGDTFFTTDNPVLIRNTKNLRTIMCMQQKVAKCVVTEGDIIKANTIAFNDDIGKVTNNVTAMFERQAGFPPDSKEYKELEYRIMCGQHYQQATIDRAKGAKAARMPNYWYSNCEATKIKEDDAPEVIEQKEFRRRIAAIHKPYFMTYVYRRLKAECNQYVKFSEQEVRASYGRDYGLNTINELREYEQKTEEMETTLFFFDKCMPVGSNPCVVNRIAVYLEDVLSVEKFAAKSKSFDASVYKSDVQYSPLHYQEIGKLCKAHSQKSSETIRDSWYARQDSDDNEIAKDIFNSDLKRRCYEICSNRQELCNIMIDLSYYGTNKVKAPKHYAWVVCGDVILENLLENSGHTISYPQIGGHEFEFGGDGFEMKTIKAEIVKGEDQEC